MAADARRLPRLPACKQCSQKKIKCDSNRPKCQLCSRNGSDCVILDSVSQEWVSRAYIDELERLEQGLVTGARSTQASDNETVMDEAPATVSPEEVPTAFSMTSSSTVTRGGGLHFISLLFADADWRRSNADLLRSLARAPGAADTPIEACPLPPGSVVRGLFERYLEWSHILSPFLLRQEVWDIYGRVFSSAGGTLDACSHDLFRTFIICAISSVIPYRNGMHPQHPEGYYCAALQHLDPSFLTRGLASVQDLLLIARFGVYHQIGTSIWDLIRLAGRLCTEQGLQCGDGETGDLLQDQHRRRVFWQFYLIDRYSSPTLDRPYAIDDRCVEVSLPVEADDEDLIAANSTFRSLDAFQDTHRPTAPNEMTIFLFCIRLRLISSQYHVEVSRLRQDPSISAQPHLAVGRICATLNRLLKSLAAWRDSAPTIQSPRCLYESQEWFDLLHSREKIGLLRRAVDLAPKIGGAPPRHILALFLSTALQTIEDYSSLSQRRTQIVHTRAYFHMLFTVGLSVMYCTSVSSNLSHDNLLKITHGLRICESTLVNMTEQLRDAYSYVTVFEALHRHITRMIQRALGNPTDGTDHAPRHAEPPVIQAPSASTTSSSQFYQTQERHPALQKRTTDYPLSTLEAPTFSQDWAATMRETGFGSSLNDFNGHYQMDSNHGYDLRRDTQDASMPGEGLLEWAFINDESLWNMDMMLGEYVYGDPSTFGLIDGVDFLNR